MVNLRKVLFMKEEIINEFKYIYKKDPEGYVYSGGRFELLGNHTDHNHGKTLASTCSLMIEGAFCKEENNIVRLVSKRQCEFEIDITNTEPQEEKVDKSACFIRGIAHYLKLHGYKVGGFSVYTESTVPPGAGVSSSAAFEILLGKVFNKLYNDNKMPRTIILVRRVVFSIKLPVPQMVYLILILLILKILPLRLFIITLRGINLSSLTLTRVMLVCLIFILLSPQICGMLHIRWVTSI